MNTIKTSMLTDEQLNKMSKDDIIIAYKLQSNAFVDMEGKLQWFMEQVHLNNQKKYGPSSEKWAYPDGYEQMNIFNEAEATANPSEEEPEYEEVVVKRKKATRSKGKKELDLSKFPVEHKIIELSEEEKSCVQCGEGRLEQFTSEKNRYLKFIPAQFIVEEIETEIYKCNTTDCGNIVRPKKDPSLFKGSIATPSLVSSIINNKYVNALPLARQEREFTRQGVNLSRQTMANWMIYSSEYYLSAIYDEFHKRLMTYPAIQADETRVQVLKEENRKSETQSAMWIYRSSELCKMAPVVIFNYQMTRAGYHPKNFLKNYSGYLTVDGYKVYLATQRNCGHRLFCTCPEIYEGSL